ncbi:SelB C-terminal domain-containing protein [Actinosynnema sp. NPDC020468]|uniref:SelB domain-containing protein n=1 Tax=Actinosynnema sp. NPDC020468 TaxID=3154488 RepID=UPI0033F16849
MHVIATAGHVDHGKSTLVRSLTGMEPDRWAQERRRGLTIDLGFAWTSLPGGGEVAFVDVPGHERFVPNMLAGVGSVPAVLFVVAADAPWMPQAAEHLAALDALGVRHGLLVVTRADLADPAPIRADALARIARTTLGPVPSVVSPGGDLRAAVEELVRGLPAPDVTADVRLWVDRSFTVAGAGTVVTGTLQAGTLRAGDELVLNGGRVAVRGLQALGRARDEVPALARVAVNLRGVARDAVRRGDALLTPGAWRSAEVVDVAVPDLPRQVVLHVGSAAVPVRVHRRGAAGGRLVLGRPLPLRVGDRVLLRDPGGRRVVGADVLDVDRLGRRVFLRADEWKALGRTGINVVGDWYADEAGWRAAVDRTREVLTGWRAANPVDAPPAETLRSALRLPDPELVAPLVAAAGPPARQLPEYLEKALEALASDFRTTPFRAPDAVRLAELGLGSREIAAAVRAGRLVKVAERVVLAPDAVERAARALSGIPQPFTTSRARQEWDTSRRVALALLDLLDRRGVTERLPDDTRQLR